MFLCAPQASAWGFFFCARENHFVLQHRRAWRFLSTDIARRNTHCFCRQKQACFATFQQRFKPIIFLPTYKFAQYNPPTSPMYRREWLHPNQAWKVGLRSPVFVRRTHARLEMTTLYSVTSVRQEYSILSQSPYRVNAKVPPPIVIASSVRQEFALCRYRH
jgi:hypothetical protein